MTRRLSRPALAAAAIALAAACASTPPSGAQELPGCYYFDPETTPERLDMPWGVRLSPDSLTGWPPISELPNTFEAVTLINETETADHPFRFWRVMPSDSIRIGYPAMGGWSLNLEVVEGGLVGTARSVGDAGLGERPVYEIRLLRASCPEEKGAE